MMLIMEAGKAPIVPFRNLGSSCSPVRSGWVEIKYCNRYETSHLQAELKTVI